MSQVSEIRCPHCGAWTMWQGHIDDRCISCGEFLETRRFSLEVEKRITRELKKDDDYFAPKPTDSPERKWFKSMFNSFRWGVYYVQLALFTFITIVILIISLLAG